MNTGSVDGFVSRENSFNKHCENIDDKNVISCISIELLIQVGKGGGGGTLSTQPFGSTPRRHILLLK